MKSTTEWIQITHAKHHGHCKHCRKSIKGPDKDSTGRDIPGTGEAIRWLPKYGATHEACFHAHTSGKRHDGSGVPDGQAPPDTPKEAPGTEQDGREDDSEGGAESPQDTEAPKGREPGQHGPRLWPSNGTSCARP